MKLKNLVLFLLVVAFLSACGKPAATPAAGATTAKPTTAPPGPTAAPTTASDDVDLGSSSNLDKLDSYRAAYRWQWTETKNGTKEEGFWDVLEEFSKADNARHTIWKTNDGSFEVISIGQYSYWKSDDENWIAMLTSEENLFGSASFLADPLSGVAGNKGRLVQRGMNVNGVSADHYKVDEKVSGTWVFGVADKWSGDVYIAPKWDITVKYNAHYEGANLAFEGGTNGVLDITYDLTQINQPIKITAPEGVAPPLPEDIPIMADATELSAMSGVIGFKTTKTLEEVTTYYNEAMVAQGWKAGDSLMEGYLSFSKDKREATVMISVENNVTSVTIVSD
ncbi:MAG TPA: hypothetical protein PKW05_08145 [Anaerolineae bacterium]|nr:hypothetical protein [Anaerolineae bacterium]HQJ51732.1 hypothetical protein [Anaerolineae bacterium]